MKFSMARSIDVKAHISIALLQHNDLAKTREAMCIVQSQHIACPLVVDP
jgi:hypothetical protein